MNNDQRLLVIRDWMRAHMDPFLALVQQLVEQESPSGDVAGSRAVVSLLEQELRKIPLLATIERIPIDGYGEHLVVRTRAVTAARKMLIVGHTDTVHARGALAARPLVRTGSVIFGPGIFDMKGNCALLVYVLRALAQLALQPQTEVVILLTCDEETGSATGRALIESHARGASCALVMEPSAPGGGAKTARKGTGNFTLYATGIAAHAGLEPEKGASAVLEIARQIARIDALNSARAGTTINVGVVTGGSRANVVAAEACAEIDVRFQTMAEAARIESSLHGLVPFDPRVKLKLAGEINRPPLERTAGVIALYQRARAIAAQLGFELSEAQVGGGSDGNFIGALGVPVLDGLGIEGAGAHADHEQINIERIPERAALIAGLILDQ